MSRLLNLLVLLGMTASVLVQPVLAAGPTVKVSQVDMSNYPQVVVYASVTDDHGKPLGGLEQTDFRITEDGIPVTLTDFSGLGDTRTVDIVFVFDTTTSMAEEVKGMKQTSLSFAEKLERSGLDYRLGLVDFGDVINRVEGSDGQLTDDAQQFKAWINDIRLAGGGYKIPEFSLGALQRATQMSFRDQTLKILILITDAPPHHYRDAPDKGVSFDDASLTLAHTLQRLSAANVTAYIIAPSHPDYLQIVDETSGQFFDIHGRSDFTTIIDQIGGLIATQYRLVYISPRPTYDGTRRNIEVTVGGAKGTATYLERHLLNIQSNPLVGLVCLVPLLILLAAPVGLRLLTRMRRPSAPVLPASFACPQCGSQLRAGAKFCSSCGRPTKAPTIPSLTPPRQREAASCPQCGYAMRPEARFCARCGHRRG